MNILLTFIKERFQLMPQWVQVSTYVSFVILFVYILTAPRFLDMRLVSNDYGDEFPIGGAQIEIEIDGRVLILLTDSKGRFSVPLSTHSPIGTYLFILSPDSNSNKIKEIEVPVANSYLKRSKIIYTKKTNTYQIVPNGIIENTQRLFSAINPITSAYADDHMPVQREGIDQEIFQALEMITRIPFEQISRNVSLRNDLGLDNIDLSYINNRLNKKYRLDALSAFQHQAKTVGDLIDIARAIYYETAQPEKKEFVPSTPLSRSIHSQPSVAKEIMAKYKQGKVLKKSKRYPLALKIFKTITEQHSDFYLAWYNLALIYEAMDEKGRAEAAFKQAIKTGDAAQLHQDKLYNRYGMFLFKQKRYTEAGVQFKKEKKLNP